MVQTLMKKKTKNKNKKNKKTKKGAPAEKYAHSFWKRVSQSKLVKVSYFQEQGLEVFLKKLPAQKLLDLFRNSTNGYSVPVLG